MTNIIDIDAINKIFNYLYKKLNVSKIENIQEKAIVEAEIAARLSVQPVDTFINIIEKIEKDIDINKYFKHN